MISIKHIDGDGEFLFGNYHIYLDNIRIGDLEYTSQDDVFYIDSMWIDETHRGTGIAEEALRLILKERNESHIDCQIISIQSLKFFVKVLGLPFHIDNKFIDRDYMSIPFEEFIKVAKDYLVDYVELDSNGNFNYKDWFTLKFYKI